MSVRAANEGPGGCVPWEEAQRLRHALEFAVEEFEDALPYVPEWARKKWGYDQSLKRMQEDLAKTMQR